MGGAGTLVENWGSANPNALTAGYKIYTVTDDNGCVFTDSVLITEPPALVLSSSSTDLLCASDTTGGTASVIASGGTPGYMYSWSNGGNMSAVSGLNSGTYTVTVTDNNMCVQTANVVISSPPALSLSATATDEMLGNDGAIDLTVTGGVSPYIYNWTPSGSGQDPSGLVAGAYFVTVTDSNNCSDTLSIMVGSQVGIGEYDEVGMDIYPNPNNGSFQITIDNENSNNFDISILSLTGKLVHQSRLTSTTKVIDIKDMAPGVYLVSVSNETTKQTLRLVVQ